VYGLTTGARISERVTRSGPMMRGYFKVLLGPAREWWPRSAADRCAHGVQSLSMVVFGRRPGQATVTMPPAPSACEGRPGPSG
jgi:hypothetical protein